MLQKTFSKIIALLSVFSLVDLTYGLETFNANDLANGKLTSIMRESFEEKGYLILKDFFSPKTMTQALEEYKDLIKSFPHQKLGQHFFETKEDGGAQSSDQYFFDSAEFMWPFYNSAAKSHPEVITADLSDENRLFEYCKVMNKIGHNIHALHPFFRDLIFQDPRLINLPQDLGYHDPSVALYQTTIISKSTVEDSKYNAHQDGTFIGPNGKVLAYWIPLTPSTQENGCLWGIPGSHKLPITQWYRKQDKSSYKCSFTGEVPTWDLSQKVYLEVNPGDLLIFPGSFIHGSDPSHVEPKSIHDLRVALTYHFGPTTNWDELIWLKLSEKNTLPLYKS